MRENVPYLTNGETNNFELYRLMKSDDLRKVYAH